MKPNRVWNFDSFAKTTNRSRSARRHPAEVTSDRLAEASEKWHSHFSGEELDMISQLRFALERIANGNE